MLDALFRPRAIAVIGASNNPYSIGNIVIRNLLDYGFQVRSSDQPQGKAHSQLKTYKSVLEVRTRLISSTSPCSTSSCPP